MYHKRNESPCAKCASAVQLFNYFSFTNVDILEPSNEYKCACEYRDESCIDPSLCKDCQRSKE